MLRRFWNWLLGQTTIDEKIEEKVDNAKRTIVATKKKVNKVVEEAKDVIEAVQEAREDIFEEIKDVVEAVSDPLDLKGKVTKTKLREANKGDLVSHAKARFDVELDPKLTKTNLINKVYELHHKK